MHTGREGIQIEMESELQKTSTQERVLKKAMVMYLRGKFVLKLSVERLENWMERKIKLVLQPNII